MFVDARIPLRFGRVESAGPEDALLVEGEAVPAPGRAMAWFRPGAHAPGCACATSHRRAPPSGVTCRWYHSIYSALVGADASKDTLRAARGQKQEANVPPARTSYHTQHSSRRHRPMRRRRWMPSEGLWWGRDLV